MRTGIARIRSCLISNYHVTAQSSGASDFLSVCNMIWYVLSTLALTCIVTKLYVKLTAGVCKSKRKLHGKTVIVTGANTGIGKETARDLAQRGARVILACRDRQRGLEARDDIIKTTGNTNVVLEILDLTSLSSVRMFAKRIKETEKHLEILINNAGAAGMKPKLTKDNLQIEMQINHFAPFLLTLLLLDLLKKSAPSRIIMVSSRAHIKALLEIEKINEVHPGLTIYANSKLCNILFANELAQKLEGTGVTVNSLHPGIVFTDIFRRLPKRILPVALFLLKHFAKTAEEGAQTSIFLAVSEDVEGITGKYFADCKEIEPSPKAKDEELGKQLWMKSEELVNLKSDERLC